MKLPGDISLTTALSVWRRNLTEYSHTWLTNILPNFFDPVLYLLGMGLGLGMFVGRGVNGLSYIEYIAPGLMAASAMQGASFETTYNVFVKMNFAKLYDAYLATPAQIQDIAFGEQLWANTRGLIYGCAFMLVLIGFTLAGNQIITSWWAVLLPVAMLMTANMFALIGLTFTASIRNINYYGFYYTLWLTPLFLFSGIFFPLDNPNMAGGHAATIAWFTPLYHSVKLMRGLAQGPLDWTHAVSAVWILVVSGVLSVIVPRRMRKRMIH
ncbi:MAG: ABC transporter permease [Planctomycetes bacterium]|nr:ABC transporter permease [Planctomycetota bacterium]